MITGFMTGADQQIAQDISNIQQFLNTGFSEAAAQIDQDLAAVGEPGAAAAAPILSWNPILGIAAILSVIGLMVLHWAIDTMIVNPLRPMVVNIPLVGGFLGDLLDGYENWALMLFTGNSAWLYDNWQPINAFITTKVLALPIAIVSGITGIAGKLAWILDTAIQDIYSTVWKWVHSAQSAAIETAQSIGGSLAETITTVSNTVNTDREQILGFVNQQLYDLQHQIDLLQSSQITQAQALQSATEHSIQQAMQQVTVQEGAAIQATASQIGQQIGTVQTDQQQQLQQQVAGLTGMITQTATVLSGAFTSDLGGLQTELQTKIDNVANKLKTALDTCVEPACEAGHTNDQNVLSLGQMLTTAGIWAYLSMAIRYPVQTANDTVDIVQPIIGAAGGIVDDIVSLVA